MARITVILLLLCSAFASCYGIEIPKASGKALGVTKGKEFSKGMVFVDGRYIEPPYVVERWGVGIRINKTPVIGQVIDWASFVKTQPSAKLVKSEPASDAESAEPEEKKPEVAETVEVKAKEETEDAKDEAKADAKSEESSGEELSVDDLFDDEPATKKPEEKKPEAKASVAKVERKKPKPAKPAPVVTYSFEGEFQPTTQSEAMKSKINKVRTEINASLLKGGFICFGENYSRVTGDARTAELVLQKLPDILKQSNSEAELVSLVRSAGLVYLTEPVCRDLYRNRRDYLKLQARRAKERENSDFKNMINNLETKSGY